MYLGAFRKHPGWNHHLDGIGLLTGPRVTARRLLYDSDISSKVEGAAWEQLDPGKLLPESDPVFACSRCSESIVGLMLDLEHGEGSAQYPLILAVHTVGYGPGSLFETVLPELEWLAGRCRTIREAGAVVTGVHHAEAILRARPVRDAPGDRPAGTGAWATYFAKRRKPLVRLFHHLEL